MVSEATEVGQPPSNLGRSNPTTPDSLMHPDDQHGRQTQGEGANRRGNVGDAPDTTSEVDLTVSSSSDGPVMYRNGIAEQSTLPLNSLTVSSSSSSEEPPSTSRTSLSPPIRSPLPPPPPMPPAAPLTQAALSVGTARAVQTYHDALQFDRLQQEQLSSSSSSQHLRTTAAPPLASFGSRGTSTSSHGSGGSTTSSLKSPNSLRPLYPSLDRLSSIPDVVTESPLPTHSTNNHDRDPVLDDLTASAAYLTHTNTNGNTYRPRRLGGGGGKLDEEEKREIEDHHGNNTIMASAEEFVFASEALGWEGMDFDYNHSTTAHMDTSAAAAVVAVADDNDEDEELLQLKRQAYDPWQRPSHSVVHDLHHNIDTASPQHATVVSITDPMDLTPTAISSAVGRQVSVGSVHAVWIGHEDTDATTTTTSISSSHGRMSSQYSTVASSSLAELDDSTNATATTTTTAARATTATAAVHHGDDEDTAAAEVTVIDHAPLHSYHRQLQGGRDIGYGSRWDDDQNEANNIVPAWKCHGEAQVLEECEAHNMEEYDSKPPAIDRHPRPTPPHTDYPDHDNRLDSNAAVVVVEEQFAVAHPEAEVVDIEHDVHPLEYADHHDAEAELVGVVASQDHEHVGSHSPHSAAARHMPSDSEASAVAVATPSSDATGHETPTTAAVITMIDYDLQQPTPTVSNVSVIRNGFARAPPLPSRAPFGGGQFSNPFEDDPNDPPSLSLDAIAQLDAQADQSWRTVPTIVEHEPNVQPATPVAATLPVTSETNTTAASSEVAARPLKTVESEMPPRDWGDDDIDYYRPHRREEVPDWLRDESARDLPARPPPPRPFGMAGAGTTDHRSASQTSGLSMGSQRSITGGPAAATVGGSSGVPVSGTSAGGVGVTGGVPGSGIHMMSQVMEALFGDAKPSFLMGRSVSTGSVGASHILTRILLPWSVIYNPTKKMWVATLQTNQNALDSNDAAAASKSLRAFSLPTEKRAICLAQAWTPPRMQPFSESPTCHICDSRFAVFRRACHCRNCGVCICRTRECAVQWPSKMIPETYNLKREAYVNICKTCDWLCNSFRLSLLEGDFDKVVALHSTGNINVNSPFANVKGELFYPVHCAVLGGNLDLLRWLVDEHCCPIKSMRVSGKTAHNAGTYTPIVTSKGRSLLGIAMETGNIPIMRYLVVEKGISVAGEKDITTAMLVQSFTAVLFRLPADALHDSPRARGVSGREESGVFFNGSAYHFDDDGSALMASNGRTLSEEARDFGAIYKHRDDEGGDDLSDHADECIICYDNKIDCVSNPCGHQIMCMSCAENISRCPVCASECTFIRVYKP